MLPRLVPRNQLVAANARLGQAGTVAQTTGPALGGLLVGWLSAPIAILIDAVGYVVSAVLLGRIKLDEAKAERRAAGRRFGVGGAVLAGRTLSAVAWLAVLILPAAENIAIVAIPLAIGQFLFGLGMGLEDPNEMGYRQAVAPDQMQGRLNASIRTVNRVMFLIGALVAGGLATAFGFRVTIGVSVAVFAIAALIVLLSPLRTARHDDL